MRIILSFLLLTSTIYCHTQIHQIGFLNSGAKLGNYKKYDYNMRYKQSALRAVPTISYQYNKGNWGVQATGVIFVWRYIPLDSASYAAAKIFDLESSEGFYFHLDAMRKILGQSSGSIHAIGGITTKYSIDWIGWGFGIPSSGFTELIKDENAN